MKIRNLACLIAVLPCAIGAQDTAGAPDVLPGAAVAKLARSLEASAAHARHVWRDMAPLNDDGTVNAYIEIARGDRRKWEFDMSANVRAIDRIIQEDVGGYPINYGFVPQTVSYDGDPFDALVLGPPMPGADLVSGTIVGLMIMEDQSVLDSKVVLSPIGPDGRPLHELDPAVQRQLADYVSRYKQHQPGAVTKVPGWGSAADGLAYVRTTHAFFRECRRRPEETCRVTSASSLPISPR
jgi:inorganic pyrophosphatase